MPDQSATAHLSAATPPASSPLRVLECSRGIMGAYAGWLLALMGAEVTRLATGRDPALDIAPERGPNAISVALDHFNAGKLPSDPASTEAALRAADIVITDDAPALSSLAGRTLDALAADHAPTVFGVASIFGCTGPRAALPATPLDAQAVSSVAWAIGTPNRAPLAIPPGILECQAGAHLAAASLMARFAPATAQGRIADVALADVLAHYVSVNCRFYIHHGMQWHRAGRRASNSGGAYPFVILPCQDGDVCLTSRTRPEWERFIEAMGTPAWSQEPRYQKLRAMGQQYPEEVDALILPWLSQRTKAEIEDIANRYQLTIAPLRRFDEILATPQLAERRFWRSTQLHGRTLRGPGLPFKATPARAPDANDFASSLLAAAGTLRSSTDASMRLEGVRVLDLGWVWSAPQVGSMLAQFGAQVIKVEHGKRLDNTRLSGAIFRDGQKVEGDSTEMSPMFHQINKGKLGITVNTKVPAGIDLVRRLAAQSDIVLENMSAGTMERNGLGYETLRAANPRLIMLAMSGAGQFGPLADMRTYAPSMSSYAGLEAIVGYAHEPPVGALNFAIGDPNAAVHALVAVFAALLRRETTNDGCYLDLAQTEALLATLSPYLLLSQIDRHQPPTQGNAHPAMAPHGIYPTANPDGWVSIAVETDAHFTALAACMGNPAWADDPAYKHLPGRLAARETIDASLSEWTRTQDQTVLVQHLRSAGIAASPVQDIAAFLADPHFAARGLPDRVALPGLGPEILFRAPWCISDIAADAGSRGPRLGEHNTQILQGLLGLSVQEFAELQAEGVIA